MTKIGRKGWNPGDAVAPVVLSDSDGSPVTAIETQDGGPAWESLFASVASEDASGGVSLIPWPGEESCVVVDDLILSAGADVAATIKTASSQQLFKLYLGANGTVQVTPRGRIVLPRSNKLVVSTDVTGGISSTVLYHLVPSDEPIPAQKSLVFDGVDDYVNCGATAAVGSALEGDFTIDVYFEIPSDLATDEGPTLFAKPDNAADIELYYWIQEDGSLNFSSYVGGDASCEVQVPGASVVGGWVYLRIRMVNGYLSMSVNAGTEVVGETQGLAITASPGDFILGAYSSSGGTYQNRGRICYLHVWDVDQGALSAVPTTPFDVDDNTVMRLMFNEGSGETLYDLSGSEGHGTIEGAVWSDDVPAGWSAA